MDAQQTKISKTELLKFTDRDALIAFLEEKGIPKLVFRFSGINIGETDGVPYAKGGYPTVANGWGENFYQSTLRAGSTFAYKEKEYFVARNGYGAGDALYFSNHSLIMVPIEAVE